MTHARDLRLFTKMLSYCQVLVARASCNMLPHPCAIKLLQTPQLMVLKESQEQMKKCVRHSLKSQVQEIVRSRKLLKMPSGECLRLRALPVKMLSKETEPRLPQQSCQKLKSKFGTGIFGQTREDCRANSLWFDARSKDRTKDHEGSQDETLRNGNLGYTLTLNPKPYKTARAENSNTLEPLFQRPSKPLHLNP